MLNRSNYERRSAVKAPRLNMSEMQGLKRPGKRERLLNKINSGLVRINNCIK